MIKKGLNSQGVGVLPATIEINFNSFEAQWRPWQCSQVRDKQRSHNQDPRAWQSWKSRLFQIIILSFLLRFHLSLVVQKLSLLHHLFRFLLRSATYTSFCKLTCCQWRDKALKETFCFQVWQILGALCNNLPRFYSDRVFNTPITQ